MNRVDGFTWAQIFTDLFKRGTRSSPRDMTSLEIENYSIQMRPLSTFCGYTQRNLSLKYFAAEMAWYFNGDPNDRRIERYSKMWESIANPEGATKRWNSNYGEQIFRNGQLQYVFRTLMEDKDSRQAVMVITSPDVIMSNTKDKICTNTISFRIRNNMLNMSVNMRSNDAVYGLGYDAPAFGLVYEILLVMLQKKYQNLQPGIYHHHADSFHIYEKHFPMMEAIVQNPDFKVPIHLPLLGHTDEALRLIVELPAAESILTVPSDNQFSHLPNDKTLSTLIDWLTDDDYRDVRSLERVL